MYERIITHSDFDGIVSAALCSLHYQINDIHFSSPGAIEEGRISAITKKDIVCDLPYPNECGMWFDHHVGNLKSLKLRKIDPNKISGRFELLPSCANVIYNHINTMKTLPERFVKTVAETNIIDSFDYDSFEDFKKEHPGKIIDYAIKVTKFKESRCELFLKEILFLIRDFDIDYVSEVKHIKEKYISYREKEEQMLKIIKDYSYFAEDDKEKEIVIIDLTNFNKQLMLDRNLAHILFPQIKAMLEINSIFTDGIKTNNLIVSLSLSIKLNKLTHGKDCGEIMRLLNIGDGHIGAAGGRVYSKSKKEMLTKKEELIKNIVKHWKGMS